LDLSLSAILPVCALLGECAFLATFIVMCMPAPLELHRLTYIYSTILVFCWFLQNSYRSLKNKIFFFFCVYKLLYKNSAPRVYLGIFLAPRESNHNDRLFLLFGSILQILLGAGFFLFKIFVLPPTLLPLTLCRRYTRGPNWSIYHFVRLAFVLSVGIIPCPLVLVIVSQTFPPL
jgi:hypothetical protein